MLCSHTVPSGVPNCGCAPNVSVGLVFFTLITNLAVGTASNLLMNVETVREVTIWRERYVSYPPRLGAVISIVTMF